MYSLDEVMEIIDSQVDVIEPTSFFYWVGWRDYLDGGILKISLFVSKTCEAAYYMGFADAKGEDYGY